MLFVQCITLRYMKDVRYANYADQRKTVKFMKLPDVKPEENEIIFSDVLLYPTAAKMNCYRNSLKSLGNDSFYENWFNNAPFSDRLAVLKDNNIFRIKYCGKSDSGFYKTKIILDTCEYGRIIFNERRAYHTGMWYYDLIIYNFVNAPYSSFNSKIFFRKEPDHEFTDMHYLRYC